MSAFGLHGCSVITALTAQNTIGVQTSEPVSEAMLREQLKALDSDLPPAAIKTGMLGSASSCKIIAHFLESRLTAHDSLLICDPVLKSTSGSNLLEPDALDILINGIFPQVDLLTPNLPETELLIGKPIKSIEDAADQLLKLGVRSALIKGGHAEKGDCSDYWTDGTEAMWLSSPRIETKANHGTGCLLSSAIASALALEQNMVQAVISAKTFLNQCLKSPANVGKGHGPMMITRFMDREEDRPKVVGEIADLASACGIADPSPQTPESTTPATTKHSHLRRLSRIFVGEPIYFITTNAKMRSPILDNPTVHNILRDEWENTLDRYGWAIGSYVVMPEHIHFFCKPASHEACKLSDLMRQWKQWTSKRIKKELRLDGSIWQAEFFDHVLRSDESYSEKWNYIEQNPVRAELVTKAGDWPYAGFIHYK